MDNYVDELKKKIDVLYDRINKERDTLIVYNLIEKSKSKYQYIFFLTEVINKNMQSGNYKRAVRYYLAAKKMMNEIEKNKKNIKEQITDYIIKD